MQKLYCFVDETGQETKGQIFIVAVVILVQNPSDLFRLCEQIEQASGKGKFKWGTAKRELRLAYLRRVFTEPRFQKSLCYSVFRDTKSYDVATIMAIAKAIHLRKPPRRYTTLVYVDGLKKSKRLKYGSELRKLGIPTRKVQGVTKDENNALVRLADALAGFVADALSGSNTKIQALFTRVRKRGVLVEV